MTFKSTVQHFLDKHAKALSQKEFFDNWGAEVLAAPNRPVEKVQLCSGVAFKDVFETQEWDWENEAYDTHNFLQVYLAGTAHHPQQIVLLERLKGSDGTDEALPHAAIPFPEDRVAAYPVVSLRPAPLDCACVLQHGSHGTDVVYNLQVERTLEFNGDFSVHELVDVLLPPADETSVGSVFRVPCQELARSFAVDSMHELTHYMRHRDRL